ncbi:MAG: M23 family metallopeptidase [Thermoleophilaceae bacterium]|nr:M23 family metallopeptidase [Thermoleophilaceae bacterium]
MTVSTSRLARSLAVLALLTAAGAPQALADSGGAAPSPSTTPSDKSGGTTVGGTTEAQRKAKSKSAAAKRIPVLVKFRLSDATLSGRSELTLNYRITASARRVRVRAIVRTAAGAYVKTLELGVHRTRLLQKKRLSARELGINRAGAYKLRLTARDGAGRAAKRAKKIPAWRAFTFADHRFPLTGPFSFGSDGARFGAGRPGHTHQGQDVVADSGTPVVAPYGGVVSHVAYQAAAAGYYVVLHADDGRDYVFMHLLKRSTAVKTGERVAAGQQLGRVGSTGASSGPHLHFEVWIDGPWQFGGHPVDPLPLLKSWLASGPGGAVRTSSIAGSSWTGDEPLD